MPRNDTLRRRLDQRAQDALAREFAESEERRGDVASTRGEFLGRLRGFDPFEIAQGVGAARTNQFLEALGEEDAAARRFDNRRGLIGGASREAGRRDIRRRVSRDIASSGFQAAGLDLQRIGQIGDVFRTDVGREEASRGRSLDFLSGERDRLTAEENARRLAEAQKRNPFLEALGIGVGTIPFLPGFRD